MLWFGAAVLVGLMCGSGQSLPVYGTTHYGRPGAAAAPSPLYYRQARPFPYPDSYNDDLYYQPMPVVHYPYYPIANHYSDGDLYRTVYPYYYSPYGYYGSEDAFNPAEDSLHEDHTSNNRADALPVGQETWFEGDSAPSWRSDYDDVNAAFLQNLIMSQMYDDSLDKSDGRNSRESPHQNDDYEDRRAQEYYGDRNTRDFEDEDVRELKALAGKPLYHVPKTSVYSATGNGDSVRRAQLPWYQELSTPNTMRRDDDQQFSDDYQGDEGWINWGSKRSPKASKVEAVKRILATKPTSMTVTTTARPIVKGGQKEEVLLRPATPARHPFPEPVLHLLANTQAQTKRSPSVYDTIKRLLTMEESFKPIPENKAKVQKRYISTEEDLVGELKGLKLKRRSTA